MANQTLIQQMKNKQFLTTIPRCIAEAYKLKKGDKLDWMVVQGDIVVRKI